MKDIITTLMERDNLSEQEAKELLQATVDEIHEALAEGDLEAAEDIWQDNLGLELDYIFGAI